MRKLSSPIHLLSLIFLLSFLDKDAQERSNKLNNQELTSSNLYTSRYKAQNTFDGLGYYKLNNQTFNYETDKLLITLSAAKHYF
ncbi:hypothetical protein J0871_14955 [Salegentibacter sp. BDJ18]|uniref:hypothetical protein n=1 Tax=Salegentibacter sp. BDJ18 TaxID=2816376 RepID=UPI001AAEA9B3|nr:hypothetical protein [Salegentibacter sp. BDJ18]MBO2545719.1 hypothetical protein [Salegentibacter sp. BDJ18]